MASPWDLYLRETHYNYIPRRILVEPLIGDVTLMDYKFFCFGGRVKYIQIDTDRFRIHKRCFYDREWNKQTFTLKFPFEQASINPPENLGEMIMLRNGSRWISTF